MIGAIARISIMALTIAATGCSGAGPAHRNDKLSAAVATSQTAANTLDGLTGDVVDLKIVGVADERASAASAVLITRVGLPFSAARVAEDVLALWRLGGVADIHVEGRLTPRGVELRYVVREQPRLSGIDVRGTTVLTAQELIKSMSFGPRSPVEPTAFAQARLDVIDRYKELGYARVAVTWSLQRQASGDELVFNVNEGVPVTVSAIDLRGNRAVKRQPLLDMLANNGGPAVGGRYWDLTLARAELYLAAHYHDLGYVAVVVKPPMITWAADGTSVAIAFDLTEGDQYKLGSLAFSGTLVAPESEYLERLGIEKGDVFSRTKVTEGLDRIRDLHRAKGDADVDASPAMELDPAKKRIKLTIEIH